jgi:hypothetical protein
MTDREKLQLIMVQNTCIGVECSSCPLLPDYKRGIKDICGHWDSTASRSGLSQTKIVSIAKTLLKKEMIEEIMK